MKHLFSEAFKSELSNSKVIATATISKIEDAVLLERHLLAEVSIQ